MMFQSQQQRQYEHGKTTGITASEWEDDYMQLKKKIDEYNTELTKYRNKYGYGNGNHDMQTGAESGKPSKKRERWTEEECKLFVIGLAKYGRGRWKQISENVLPSKTPSQIASYAQKYFIRQGSQNKKRRSIHDITTDHVQNQDSVPPLPPPPPHNCNWDDVAAPQDHQLHQPTVLVHAEKESSCGDEAMVLLHEDLSSIPRDFWDELAAELQQQQMYGNGTCHITPQEEEEEPDFITYLNNSSFHSSPALHAAEKESDEAVILSHDLPPLPQTLQQHQQMYGYETYDITTQEEEPIFINSLNNSLSHSPFFNNNNYNYDIASVPTILPQDQEPPRFASCS